VIFSTADPERNGRIQVEPMLAAGEGLVISHV
jgi:hypothetical protein